MKISRTSYRANMARCMLGVAFLAGLPCAVQAAEWPSALNLSTLDGTTGYRLVGVADTDRSGSSVSEAGDVNGDGFDDLIVGAWRADPNDPFSGSSYVVFGKAGGFTPDAALSALDGTTGFRLDGVAANNFAGVSVSSAGDVNGDGFADLIIGAVGADTNGVSAGSNQGSSYVVYGKAGGFAPVINLSTLNGVTGFRLDGVENSDRSGISVSSAGDVNDDGFADLIVGARGAAAGASHGASFVVFGKASAFVSVVNLSTLNGATGFRLNGVAAGDYSGASVSTAGDVNGDGFADLIIGAYEADSNGATAGDYQGSSYVVFGKASGFASVISLSALNGTTGFRLDGVEDLDNSGIAVSSAGDVNGDGFTDLIVGAYKTDTNGATAGDNQGSSYVVFGKAASFASIVNLSTLDGATGFRLDGVTENDYSGGAVSSAGDVNGDGFSDLIIGANSVDTNGATAGDYQGSSYVVFGKAGSFNSVINLSVLDGVNGFRLDGVSGFDYSGRSVSSAGDVNGDGFADLIVGADLADPNAINNAGASYVILGRAPDAAVTRIGSATGQFIIGGALADELSGLDGNDVLEGGGSGDIHDGGTGSDTASYAHAPAALTASLALPAGNTGHASGDSYVSIENLEGSSFADTLTGNGGSNRLTGGKGKDKLKGGSGKDTFAYRRASESPRTSRDDIIDFNPGTKSGSVDKIDLSAIDANTTKGGNQAFTFRGTKAFNGKGQIRLKLSGKNVIIQGNTGGSSAPEFEIVLKGLGGKIGKVTAKDFKL